MDIKKNNQSKVLIKKIIKFKKNWKNLEKKKKNYKVNLMKKNKNYQHKLKT